MNDYFKITDSVFDITEKYPEIIPYLAAKGFTPLTNPVMRSLMGKKISLENALLSKKTRCKRIRKRNVRAYRKQNTKYF